MKDKRELANSEETLQDVAGHGHAVPGLERARGPSLQGTGSDFSQMP